MTASKTTLSILLLLAILFAYSSIYTVHEGQSALLLRLGKVQIDDQGNAYLESPGLHWKIPFLTQVQKFNTRLQTWNIQAAQVMTADQENINVNYYIKWRITNPLLFYTQLDGSERQAASLFEQPLNDTLRNQFNKLTSSAILAANNVDFINALNQQAAAIAKPLGINIVDLRITRIELPDDVKNTAYDRMRTDLQRTAAEKRADGKINAATITAQADANAALALATAREQAANIRAQGDTQAAKIYADAYGKDPEFYAFYRSMQAYKNIFTAKQNNILVLTPDSKFFKYFDGGQDNNK